MLIARTEHGERLSATPKARGLCPECQRPVIAKCGEIVVWHWAHEARGSCEYGAGETEWHRLMKMCVPEAWREVPVTRDGERCIADIRHPTGYVVELQGSPISPAEIRRRERVYGARGMAWLFNAIEPTREGRLTLIKKEGKPWLGFRWGHGRQSILACSARVRLDLGPLALYVRSMKKEEGPMHGWGMPTVPGAGASSRSLFGDVVFATDGMSPSGIVEEWFSDSAGFYAWHKAKSERWLRGDVGVG